jgi:molecular chaperone Hsp33
MIFMPELDISQRFIIEGSGARGELVKLGDEFQAVATHIDYPAELMMLLGQAMSAAVLLSATIKFQGKLCLQLQGEGPVTLLLAQASHERKIRGLIKWSGETKNLLFKQMIGNAKMAITIEPDKGKRYQGIVPLEGDSLSECLEHYFLQSEQLPTQIWLAADQKKAAGFLLQKLPGHGNYDRPEDWEHISILARSLTDDELLNLDFETILYRLFHAEEVRLFDQQPVKYECVCSKERCESSIKSLGKKELEEIIDEGNPIDMNCEFCGATYLIDLADLKRLLIQT